MTLNITFIAHPYLLMRGTSVRFLQARGTFGVGLASESHWLQLVLVLAVHWWPTPIRVGGLLMQLLPSPQIKAHLLTSSFLKPIFKTVDDRHLQIKDSLVNTWKSSGMCPQPSTLQWTTRIWLDSSLRLSTCKHLLPTIFQNLVGEWPT